MPFKWTRPSWISSAPRWLMQALFVLLTLGISMLIGAANRPDDWYVLLDKPAYNPPAWVFGPVWTVLYILIGLAGAAVWMQKGTAQLRLLWLVQMILNWIWTPVFFGAHRIDWAFGVLTALFLCLVLFVAAARRTCRLAALYFLPYTAWVAFAGVLNLALWMRNS